MIRLSGMRRLWATILNGLGAVILLSAISCGGGGGGGGSGSFEVVGASAQNVGLLPQSGLFLNQRLIFEFTDDVDPRTVRPETFRIRLGPRFSMQADGDFLVGGTQVTFVPRLPTQGNLGDAGLMRASTYRIEIQGSPNTDVVKSESGRPLASTFVTTFSTRGDPPLLADVIPGSPRVTGVLLDLNGDGEISGNGLCQQQVQPEQFLDRNAPEYAGCSNVTNLRAVPFQTDLRVGSVQNPLVLGLFFSEPVLQSDVLADLEDTNGDAIPDGDGQADNFILSDVTHLIDLDGDGDGDISRPIPFKLDFIQEFELTGASAGRYFVQAKLTVPFTLLPIANIKVQALPGIRDFAGNGLVPFSATFATGATPPTNDRFFESFEDFSHFDPISTAEWNTSNSLALQSGQGLGGSGSDGAFTGRESAFCVVPDPNSFPNVWVCTLDTNLRNGVFNFTSFHVPIGTTVVGRGSNALRINVIDDMLVEGVLAVDGGAGQPGQTNNNGTRMGGAGGPGGAQGGSTMGFPQGTCTPQDPCFGETGQSPEGNPGGGGGGQRPNQPGGAVAGGAGGGYGTPGDVCEPGQTCRPPGAAYGSQNIEPFLGGSGGGGAGNGPRAANQSAENTGGAGGGGGGALLVRSGGMLMIPGTISADGGDGGQGAVSAGTTGTGGGGGGSGGAIKLQAGVIAPVLGTVTAAGGAGGGRSSPGRMGGAGGAGRMRFEDLDGIITVGANVGCPPGTTHCQPPTFGAVSSDEFTTSVALSTFYDTNVTNHEFFFDASFPSTGEARLLTDGSPDPSVTDVHYDGTVSTEVCVTYSFSGAQALATSPNEPDPATITDFRTDINSLNNDGTGRAYQFIRFRVEFSTTGAQLSEVSRPIIEDLRIRFDYP